MYNVGVHDFGRPLVKTTKSVLKRVVKRNMPARGYRGTGSLATI